MHFLMRKNIIENDKLKEVRIMTTDSLIRINKFSLIIFCLNINLL